MPERLGGLKTITDMMFDLELARLKTVSDELAALKAEIDRLAAANLDRVRQLGEGGASEDLAFLQGCDARWSSWVVREKIRLNRDLATLAARREEQRMRARKALGKRDAVQRLSELEAETRAQDRRRDDFA